MRVIDITGLIHTGMWSYEKPFPNYELKPISQPEWIEYRVYMEEFRGFCSQTGTYLETPAHLLGYERSYPLLSVPVEKLVNVKTCVIQLSLEEMPLKGNRRMITRAALRENVNEEELRSCDAILVSTGWGKNLREDCYVERSPFFTFDAMEWIVHRKPSLLGSDSPRWENIKNPEGFFPMFYEADILMLAPCVSLEQIECEVVELTVLPLKIENTCCTPCRAVVIERN
jgi:kynurenine formamidase